MRYRLLAILSFLAIALCGCAKSSVGTEEDSVQIKMQVKTNSNANIVSIATRNSEADPTYRLTIYNSSNEIVRSYEDAYNTGDLRLKAGTYRFVVESGTNSDAAINNPYYIGEKVVNVVAGAENLVEITAKFSNVKVSAAFSEIIKDSKNFSNYDFSIGSATLTPQDIEKGNSIFLSAKPGEYNWEVSVTNVQGTKSTFKHKVSNVEPSSHYKFYFDVDIDVDDNGSLSLDLKIDSSLVIIKDTIDINLEKKTLPSFVATGMVLGQQKIIKEQSRDDVLMVLDMFVPAQTEEITLKHTSAYLYAQGLPYTVRLSEISDFETNIIKTNVGIEWSQVIKGNARPEIDFSNLAKKAPLGEYIIYVALTDKQNQIIDGAVNFAVLPDQDHFAQSVDYGAKYAVFYGEWATLDKPSDLSFEYREVGSSNWIVVPSDKIEVISEASKLYKTRVTGLQPLTNYEVRSCGNGFVYASDAIWPTFRTEDAPEVPNLNFDEGYTSGKNWYPNASGGNSYWATGNDGVTMTLAGGKASNTTHTDDAVSGKAVKMFTYTDILVVKVAAGNLFTGTYSTNISDPLSSAKFGRPYTGRPLGLRGWYKYFPKTVTAAKESSQSHLIGKMDNCQIQIYLEDWGSSTTKPSNAKLIASGELVSDKEVSNYTQFEIMMEYYSSDKPTHISIVCASSYHGYGVFAGGPSELFVDDFELIWE